MTTKQSYIVERREKLEAELKAIEKANWLLCSPTPLDVAAELETLAASTDQVHAYFLNKTAAVLKKLPNE